MSSKSHFDVLPDGEQEPPYNENGEEHEESNSPEDVLSEFMTTAPLPIKWAERLKFGLIWGLNLAQQDFEKYFLYFLLTNVSDPVCDYYTVYSAWILVASIVSYPINVLSGWLTDYTGKFQHRVQQIALSLQTLALFGLVACALAGHSKWGQFFYQVRQAAITQSMTSVWKLLKIRIDVENARLWIRDPDSMAGGRALDVENVVVSGMGNFGDVASEVVEISTVGSLYLMSFYCKAETLTTVSYIYCGILNVIPLAISFTIRTSDLRIPPIPGHVKKAMEASTPPAHTDSPSGPKPAEPHSHSEKDEVEGSAIALESSASSSVPDVVIKNSGDEAKCSGNSSSSNSSEKSSEETEKTSILRGNEEAEAAERNREMREVLYDGWMWLWVRIKYMFVTMPVINTMIHSVCVLVMYYIMTYPITLLVNTEEKESSYSDDATLTNYCHGTLTSLLRQGIVLMVCYLVLSFMYMALLVRCPPRIYYTWILGILEIATGTALVGILLFRKVLPSVALNLLVSFAQIIPYYINAYTYYVMNTAIRQDYYGLILAVYAFGTNAVIIGADFALYFKINVYILVLICLALMGITWVHGFLMRRLFLDPNWAEKAAAAEN